MSLFSNRSIVRRLQLGVGVAAGVVLGLTVWFNYRTSRAELEEQTNAKAISGIRAAAQRLDDFVARIGMLPRSIASRQQSVGRDPDPGLVPYLRELLISMPKEEVYGIDIAFEHKEWTEEDSMPWVDRKSWPNTTRVNYDYHDPKHEWYAGPKLSRSFYVTEPYFDEGGSDITMVTLSMPVFDSASNFIGVAASDIALDRIREMVRAARMRGAAENRRGGTNEYAYLVSRAGKLIAHPNEELMLRRGFPGVDIASRPAGESIAAKPEGFAVAVMDGERRRVYWATSPLTGWKIVLNISEDEILIPIRKLTVRSTMVGLGGLVALLLVVSLIARRLTHPLVDLTRAAAALEQGNFREETLADLPQRQDELGELSRSFQKMAREIRSREQSLAELNQSLEQTVGQRTAELTARAGELEELTRQSQEKVVIESSLSALNTSLRGNLTVAQAAERALAGAIEFLGAPMGALFVTRADGVLHRLASHAYRDSDGLPKSFLIGNGIVGQAAQSRRLLVTEPEREKLRVHFGFGAVAPSQIAACPLLANDSPVGVLELCLFKPLTGAQTRWLEKASETVANVLRFALESEERRQASFLSDMALELTNSGYWHVDYHDPDYYYQSERAARIVGEEIKPDGRYHLQNEWFSRLLEADPDLAQQTAERYEGAIEGRYKTYDATYAYKRPSDGRIIWLHASGSLVRGEDGKARFMYGVYQDVTEFRRLETELRLAMQKAEEATAMKSMFLANMSHEIRTPMNAIIGLSHLALKTQLTPKQRDYVAKVHNAGTSLLAIINDILDFSKIEAGRLDLETTDFKLDDVIGSVTTLTAQRAHEKGLEFLAHLAPGIPDVLLGDPLRLGQILTNFVNNAVKFTEHGEIRLEIAQVERTGEKVQLKFSVRDSGLGMTPEQSARLFQPFTQADMSTTRKHGGTGLGLTICLRLVELMGGRIWLESEPGVGSTFYFTVWLGVGSATGSGKTIPEKLGQLCMLVVDDNSAAREILQEPLSTVARRVDAVASGKEALAAIRQRDATDPYDIVFMDWRMPGMDGLETSRYIKSDETLKHQPAIVLVTAFGREELREEAERLQLDGFLVKPVTKSMIVDTLVNVFAEAGETGGTTTESEQSARLRGARILLTEDNEINQQIAVELLEGAGATVEVAHNGREAVEVLSNGPQPPAFDMVLMDLQMPEMDGYQATAKLRSDVRFATLPIIAMTAHATMEEKQRCLAAGMNDHIPKPIDPGNLFETVGRYYKPPQLAAVSDQGAGFTPLQPPKRENGEDSPSPPMTAKLKRTETRAPQPSDDLPSVIGLETKDGLTRVAGNRKLYLKLLRQFIEQQGPAVGQIAAALAAGDTALAERHAHTLKGVAGNIGARQVQTAAGALEQLIHANAAPGKIDSARQQAAGALDPLIARLEEVLNAYAPETRTPAAASAPMDPAQSRAAAAQLIQLLSEFDPSAADWLEANSAALLPLFADREWPTFEKLVQDYSFAGAQEQLEQALKKLNVT